MDNKGHFILITARYTNDPPNKYVYFFINENQKYLKHLRKYEKKTESVILEANSVLDYRELSIEMILNVKENVKFSAYMDLLKTLSVCLLLGLAALFSYMDQKDFI